MNQQLADLHRTVRRQHHSIIGLTMTLTVLLLSAALPQDDQTLKLRELTIVDAEGTALITLGVGEAGRSQIVMHAGEKRDSLIVGTTALGHAAIDLFNKNGDRIISLGGTKDGHGGIRVESEDTTPAYYMGRDLCGNGQVPGNAHPGRRLD